MILLCIRAHDEVLGVESARFASCILSSETVSASKGNRRMDRQVAIVRLAGELL